ncbi:MAG: hypothetical protein AB8G18_13445 [Gammaproteobacteria bacterium]
MKLSKAVYEKCVKGFLLTHATILNSRLIEFAAHTEIDVEKSHQEGFMPGPDEVPCRIISYAPDIDLRPGAEGVGHVTWNGGIRRLYASFDDRILAVSDRYRTFESRVDPSVDMRLLGGEVGRDYDRGVWGLRRLDDTVYVFGSMRKLHRRVGVYEWDDLTDPEKHANLYKDIDDWKANGGKFMDMELGFHAMDGFSSTDIYAGGDRGDMWHYNGEQWSRIDLPGNLRINAICCGGDGNVYVGGSAGYVLKGRGEDWEAVNSARDDYVFAADINSMAWFNDQLFVATEMDLFYMKDNELTKYEFPHDGPQQHSFKNVTSCDSALLSYGQRQALVFDGQTWEEIIGTPALDQG